MTPVYQTIFQNDSAGRAGNCLQAALASILEVELNDVPHFVDLYDNDWFKKMIEWLLDKGYTLDHDGIISKEEYYLAVGKSPRFDTGSHAVVYQNENLAHDPHPDGLGITEVYWLGILKHAS